MNEEKFNLEEEQKRLVLARFKTLNPEAKILLGGDQEVTVKELMKHIEDGDAFGKQVIKVQIKMLKVLARGT